MYETVLLSIDIHDESSWAKALPVALDICKTFGADLHVVGIVPDMHYEVVAAYLPADARKNMVDDVVKGVQKFVAEQVPAEVGATPHVAAGSIYSGIIETAEKVGADLIIMASHRPEMGDYLLGPNSAKVVRHSPRSVLVVRN